MTTPDPAALADLEWRAVERRAYTYVYCGPRLVAMFGEYEDAARAVADHNASLRANNPAADGDVGQLVKWLRFADRDGASKRKLAMVEVSPKGLLQAADALERLQRERDWFEAVTRMWRQRFEKAERAEAALTEAQARADFWAKSFDEHIKTECKFLGCAEPWDNEKPLLAMEELKARADRLEAEVKRKDEELGRLSWSLMFARGGPAALAPAPQPQEQEQGGGDV